MKIIKNWIDSSIRYVGIFGIIWTGMIYSCQPDPSSDSVSSKMEQSLIFPLQDDHVHGPTLAVLPDGDVLAAWFQGSGERWADDVRIMGARKQAGDTAWSAPFLMADVKGFPDINPVLYLDPQDTLWLFWYPVLANQWETSIPMYRKSIHYAGAGAPEWDWQDIILAKPGDKTERGIQPDDKFVREVQDQLEKYGAYAQNGFVSGYSEVDQKRYWTYWDQYSRKVDSLARGENMLRRGRLYEGDTYRDTTLGYPLARRIGWQTKNKPVLAGDRLILPLYSDGFDASMFALTEDHGQTWEFSNPVLGGAGIQPTILQRKDGGLVAYLRDNGPPPKRMQRTESHDGGLNWSIAQNTHIPNSGAGFDGVTLDNGDWVMAYNDLEDGRYDLTIALSEDEGASWRYKNVLEHDDRGRAEGTSFHYPSIVQDDNGRLHVIYSYHMRDGTEPAKSIKYASFPVDWIKE